MLTRRTVTRTKIRTRRRARRRTRERRRTTKRAKTTKKTSPSKSAIDLDGIGQRIVSMPIKAANYVALDTGKAGALFLTEAPGRAAAERGRTPVTVTKFDLKTRKPSRLSRGVSGFAVSANGEKVLYHREGPGWFIAATGAAPKPGEGALKLRRDGSESRSARRMEPDVSRSVAHRARLSLRPPISRTGSRGHGKEIRALLKGAGGRADVNHLFEEMLGEVTIGHMFICGGDIPKAPEVKSGLLGADYKVENGRYRFAQIFNGENWNPELRAPLTQPGVDVKAGRISAGSERRRGAPADRCLQLF